MSKTIGSTDQSPDPKPTAFLYFCNYVYKTLEILHILVSQQMAITASAACDIIPA